MLVYVALDDSDWIFDDAIAPVVIDASDIEQLAAKGKVTQSPVAKHTP